MSPRSLKTALRSLLLAGVACVSATALATDLQITITNQNPAGGFAFSGVWLGIHSGSFDNFDSGSAANGDVEAAAELADLGPVSTTFTGQGPQTVLAPGGPYAPGATATTTISVPSPATTRFVSYLAMVVPSNDMFFGNDDPQAVELFDAGGTFLGPTTINVFGGNVWDAGTEVNNANDGAAFLVGQDATLGTDENGTVGLFLDRPDAATYLASILGKTTPAGYDISELISAQGLIATIQIQEVPEPDALALAGVGAAALVLTGRRRHGRRRPR